MVVIIATWTAITGKQVMSLQIQKRRPGPTALVQGILLLSSKISTTHKQTSAGTRTHWPTDSNMPPRPLSCVVPTALRAPLAQHFPSVAGGGPSEPKALPAQRFPSAQVEPIRVGALAVDLANGMVI